MTAFMYAVEAHQGQTRKGFTCDFIAHPLAVAANVMEWTGAPLGSDVVNAAFLHDTVEDTMVTLEDLIAQFGFHTAYIVACVTHDPKLSGRPKREKYIETILASEGDGPCIVSAADKLDNLRSIRHNQFVGTAQEFRDNMWFYADLIDVYKWRLDDKYKPFIDMVQIEYHHVQWMYDHG